MHERDVLAPFETSLFCPPRVCGWGPLLNLNGPV